jgi:hypothetical protein
VLRAIAFGLAVGAAIQAFRQWPADGPVTVDAAVAVFLVGLLAAYFGGRARRGSAATATATAVSISEANANAQAHQSVQVAVVLPGAGASPHGIAVPGEGEHAPLWWSTPRGHLEVDQLDGMDAADLSSAFDLEREEA